MGLCWRVGGLCEFYVKCCTFVFFVIFFVCVCVMLFAVLLFHSPKILLVLLQDGLRPLRHGLTGFDCSSDWFQLDRDSEVLNIHYYEPI